MLKLVDTTYSSNSVRVQNRDISCVSSYRKTSAEKDFARFKEASDAAPQLVTVTSIVTSVCTCLTISDVWLK